MCLQQSGAEDDCCVGDAGHISNLGAAPDETPTTEQEQYFSQVCFLTETSIIRYIASSSPTSSPLAPEAPTPAPFQPVAPSPSAAPSGSMTVPQTNSPSSLPSVFITDAPTSSPISLSPSPPPTGPPTAKPSSGPTFQPTLQPASPSAVPTGTVATTDSPTILPTSTIGPSSATPVLSSPSPTATPTTATPAVDVVAHTTYVIAMPAEEILSRASYRADLRSAMDLLATQVAANTTVDYGSSSRLLQHMLRSRQRRLSGMTVDVPTSVDGIIATGM